MTREVLIEWLAWFRGLTQDPYGIALIALVVALLAGLILFVRFGIPWLLAALGRKLFRPRMKSPRKQLDENWADASGQDYRDLVKIGLLDREPGLKGRVRSRRTGGRR